MFRNNTSIPANTDSEKMLDEKTDYLTNESSETASENEGGDDSFSDGGQNTVGENEKSPNSKEEGENWRVFGERGKLLVEMLKDDPEKLKMALGNDADLKSKARGWGVDVDALFSSSIPAPALESTSTKTKVELSEDEVNAVIGSKNFSADARQKVEAKAKEILSSGIVANKEIAIKTALAELKLSGNALDVDERIGAVPYGGSGGDESFGLVSRLEFMKMDSKRQYLYQTQNGRKFS